MSWRERLRSFLLPVLGLVLFALALAVLRHELAGYSLDEIEADARAIPGGRIAVALALTALSYTALAGYDLLSARLLRLAIPKRRTLLAAFLGFAASHSLGAFLGGSAIRFRVYASFEVPPLDVGRILVSNAAIFWTGFLALAGATLWLAPPTLPAAFAATLPPPALLGPLFLAPVAAYVAFTVLRRRQRLHLAGVALPLPAPAGALAQVALGAFDWLVAAGVLWTLLPPDLPVDFGRFLGAFLLAQIIGVVSHVPGGIGVFETLVLVLLGVGEGKAALVGPLLVYRAIYYVLPLAIAAAVLGVHELRMSRAPLARARRQLAAWAPDLVPNAFAIATFGAGAVLLFSGATPAEPERFEALRQQVPLALLETSHLLGSVVGVLLLLLARGLQRRLDAAWWLASIGLAAGIVLSLAKGLDWEEASVLALVLALLLPSHRSFYRRAALRGDRLSPGWIVAVALVLQASAWLVLFAYQDVEYDHELWWQFALDAHAPRSMRAGVAALVVLLAWGVRRLLRPAAHEAPPPVPAELERAAAIVARSPDAVAHLALVGDKSLLFDESGQGFVMYRPAGHALVAMGDPVGPPSVRRELVWSFRELADANGHLAVFYEVSSENLPLYLDLGLALLKLGESARVRLEGFSLDGSLRKPLRYAQRRVEREGGRFEVVPPAGVPALLDELDAVSREWLDAKRTREKGFSLGYFDRAYLSRLPVALVRRDDRIVAFANLWLAGEREEVSVDLMRHVRDAPPGVMEYLFAELMLWSRDQGYAWFDLGMAPLSGLETRALAPLWSRLGAQVFRHGERFYNFRGLRAYKEKFDPVWEPIYLAAPGGIALPGVLRSVAALISGGLSGVVKR